jgi:hypothetical protein
MLTAEREQIGERLRLAGRVASFAARDPRDEVDPDPRAGLVSVASHQAAGCFVSFEPFRFTQSTPRSARRSDERCTGIPPRMRTIVRKS